MTQFVTGRPYLELLLQASRVELVDLRGPYDLQAIAPEKRTSRGEALLRAWTKGLIRWTHLDDGTSAWLPTDEGYLALELREALGPDRSLTKAGAKALVMGAPTRATKIRLMDDGLWKRTYALDNVPLSWLTEDGLRVREILMKHRVTF